MSASAPTVACLVVVAVSLVHFASAQQGSCSPQFRSLALAAEANNETNCINFGIICANQSTTGGNRTAGPCLHVPTGVCLPFQHESTRICWQGTSACNASLTESYCADATPGPPPSLQPTRVLIQECPDNWASLCQFSCETVRVCRKDTLDCAIRVSVDACKGKPILQQIVMCVVAVNTLSLYGVSCLIWVSVLWFLLFLLYNLNTSCQARCFSNSIYTCFTVYRRPAI